MDNSIPQTNNTLRKELANEFPINTGDTVIWEGEECILNSIRELGNDSKFYFESLENANAYNIGVSDLLKNFRTGIITFPGEEQQNKGIGL